MRLMGLLVLVGGAVALYISYHADEMGLGKYEGFGPDHLPMLGLIVMGLGLAMTLFPSPPKSKLPPRTPAPTGRVRRMR